MKREQDISTNLDSGIITENWSALPKNPTVSICCITYNHRNFISDAIEGFLMQETDFPFEILIHDDASTDGTADILRDYQTKHPHLIRSVLQTENQWSQGGKPGSIIRSFARGKYIALCEGDDYWTDPLKLQKQVDFLESHQVCSLCCHNVVMDFLNEDREEYLPGYGKNMIFDKSHIYNINFIPTCSVVFYNFDLTNFYEQKKDLRVGDWPLFAYLSQFGKIGFLADRMGVYRVHDNGLWTGLNIETKLKTNIEVLEFFWQYDQIETNNTLLLSLSHAYLNLAIFYQSTKQKKLANNYIYKSIKIAPIKSFVRTRNITSLFLRNNYPNIYKGYIRLKQLFSNRK